MKKSMARFLLSIMFILLFGCLPIYLPTIEPEPYKDEELAEVRIGQTTRQEIKDLFGSNYIERNNGSIWIFGEKRHVGYFFLIIGYYGGGDYIDDHQFVVVEFEGDVVASFQFIEDPNECSVSGVCLYGAWLDDEKVLKDGIVSTLGLDDKAAKSFVPIAHGCSFYAYNLYGSRRMALDYGIATLINSATYLRLLLEPGAHTISILDAPLTDNLSHISTIDQEVDEDPIFNFDCEGGEVFLLEIDDTPDEHRNNSIMLEVDIDTARDAITNRSLVLLP